MICLRPYHTPLNFQVISLGDTIKFSLSPSTTKDRLSTNVSGVPIDDNNLVKGQNYCFSFKPILLYTPHIVSAMFWQFSYHRLLRRLIFTGRRQAVKSSFGYEIASLSSS